MHQNETDKSQNVTTVTHHQTTTEGRVGRKQRIESNENIDHNNISNGSNETTEFHEANRTHNKTEPMLSSWTIKPIIVDGTSDKGRGYIM